MNSFTLHLITVLLAAGEPQIEIEPPTASSMPGEVQICADTEAPPARSTPLDTDASVGAAAGAEPWCTLCDLDGDPFFCCMCEGNDLEYCADHS